MDNKLNILFDANGALIPESLENIIDDITTKAAKLSDEVTSIKRGLRNTDEKVRELDEEAPLNPAEADDISKAVKAKGCEVLGGRSSNAYNKYAALPSGKKSYVLRESVYRDIYSEIKRNYGLINRETGAQLSYKKLRRKYFKGALNVIAEYQPGVTLQNEIEAENELGDIA